MSSQEQIRPPEVTSGPPYYSAAYTFYLHSTAWLLRKAVQTLTGTGSSIDKFAVVETPGLGEGHVKIAICLPKNHCALGNGRALPLVLVAEGGGFVLGQPTDGEHIIRLLSDELGAIIISVDYAKSPRYPYPHALLQLYRVLCWSTSREAENELGVSVDPAHVALMGNSAGGNLVTSLALAISFTSGPCASFRSLLPANLNLTAQVLLYPSVACNRPYIERYNAANGHVRAASLPVWAATLMEVAYLPPHINTNQIFIAPLDADVELLSSLGLPPTPVLTAGKDCLKLEAQSYTQKLRDAGVEVAEHEYSEAEHGFSHHKKDYAEEREDCWKRVRDFLETRLSSPL